MMDSAGDPGDKELLATLSRVRERCAQKPVLCAFMIDFIPEGGASAGLELTVMKRAENFEKYLDLPCLIITHSYQPRLLDALRVQIALQRLRQARCANLYDFIQGISRGPEGAPPAPPPLPPGAAVVKKVPEGELVAGADGELILFRHYRSGECAPDFVNHLAQGQIVRRDLYDPQGLLSAAEYPAAGGERITRRDYYNPSGQIVLRECYQEGRGADGSLLLKEAVLYDGEGGERARFHYHDELVAWWLLRLLSDPATHYLIIIDHALHFQRYCLEIGRRREQYPQLTVIESTHNCHCVDPGEPLHSRLGDNYLFLQNYAIRTDVVVTQSARQSASIAARFPDHPYALTAIPNPLPELPRFAGYLTPARGREEIGLIGRMTSQKGHREALIMFAELVQSRPRARLHFFGSGELEEELKAQVRERHLNSRVIFHGFRADMRAVFEAITLLVVPSRFEGFPRVIAEALAVGCPVVAFDCNFGPSEMVIDGVNGYLVPPGDTSAMACRIREIFRDRRLYRRLCRGAERSAGRFDPQMVTARWAALIGGLLDP